MTKNIGKRRQIFFVISAIAIALISLYILMAVMVDTSKAYYVDILVNGDLESGISPWYSSIDLGPYWYSEDPTYIYEGNYSAFATSAHPNEVLQDVNITDSGNYTFSCYFHKRGSGESPDIYLGFDGNYLYGTNFDAGAWTMHSKSNYLSAGFHSVGIYSNYGSGGVTYYFDSCKLEYASAPPEPLSWNDAAWIYYPLKQNDDLGYYHTYSQTGTYYSSAHRYFNVWETTKDATAYAIAQFQVTDVGQNILGYYIEGNINAWPDVPSTTLRYEGLQSVNVSIGETVGAGCPVGVVANQWMFSQSTYHLLLGVWFPDQDTPFDPRPYFSRRPVEGECQVIPDEPGTTPGLGTGPAGLWEPVCTDCVPPSLAEILIIGKWIDWLACVFTNLVQCTLVRLINSIIGFIFGIWITVILAMGWFTLTIGQMLIWHSSLWDHLIIVLLNNLVASFINSILKSQFINLVWAFFKLAAELWNIGKIFFVGFMILIKSAGQTLLKIANLVMGFVEAVKDIFSVTAIDIFDLYGFSETGGGDATGLPQFGSGGVLETLLSTDGPNTAKVIWMIFFGLYYIDYQVVDQNPVFTIITYAVYGLTAWSLIWWTIKQFEDATTEST